MNYSDIGSRRQLAQCIKDNSDEYGVYDEDVCCLVLWIYSSSFRLEVRKGRTHSCLNKGEEPWEGVHDELARGKFDFDMDCGSIAFVRDDIVTEYNTERVRLINCRIGDIDEKFEGVMAYNVLYHLLPKELDRMTEVISQCSKVIVQSRKRSKSGVSDLHKPNIIIEYLSGMGFRCEVKEPMTPRPIILGHKI